MTVPVAVAELIERFERNREAYRSVQYNEAQVRIEFIDPLFEALGWDVQNRQGFAEAYKDVIHEDAIKMGGATKAPDYCFRVGGRRVFFVEAKKPSVDIREAVAPAYQLRRYAWSAKLPLSILTNFEELAAYDCRIQPNKADKASVGRILYLQYTEFLDHWEELAGIFSKEAVLKGSFDRFAQSTRLKRGTAQVDAAFLQEIESWRMSLARNFALRNPQRTNRELNFAVQRTIDRIIFLRMCEDRGIEPYGQLQSLLNGEGVYRRLCDLFSRADQRYNSGLFHFEKEKGRAEPPDELTPTLALDDKPLKEIIRGLYYPDSPYEFSVLPAEILGQVYEQFLGKVIRLTAGHRAVVEDKPEVKKAGGVYYTPGYIVEYIVKNTVGKLVEGRSPQQVASLRILDPACGSGSFLVGAYQYLLDWHRDWYVEHLVPLVQAGKSPTDPVVQKLLPQTSARSPRKTQASKPESRIPIYQGRGGQWYLTTAEKRRILLNNIYGVDIDPQAVEVTKLSLLLKVLEGENQDTLDRQLRLFHERALPDLGSNIKCGNSLVGPDFYTDYQLSFLDDEERLRINAFDWNAEFPHVLQGQDPGFDAVIGNPPWGQKAITDQTAVKRYIWQRYPSSQGIYDLFRPFVEQGIRILRDNGLFGMVLPDIVLLKDYPETRKFLLDQLRLEAIDWWGMAFSSAVIDAATIIGFKTKASASQMVWVEVHDPEEPLRHQIAQQDFRENPRYVFNLYLTAEKRQLVQALESCPKLGDYFEVHEGVHSGNIRDELFVSSKLDSTCRELYFGRTEIRPYHLRWEGRYIRLGTVPKNKTRQRYANLGDQSWHERQKVLVRRTGDYVLAAVDYDGRYASNNFFLVFPYKECSLDLDGLCALLNSPLITWYFRTIEPRRGRVFAELKIKHLTVFPLPPAILKPAGCAPLNELGRQRARVAEQLLLEQTPAEMSLLERMGRQLDTQIDKLVRQLLALHELDHDHLPKKEELVYGIP